VDTGAWFALQVIDETYTLLRVTKGYAVARRFLEKIAQSPKLERLFITEALERQAYDLLHRYADHPFSFVDATSFALMRQQRIRHAFAFDRHFATAGFLRIPGDLQP
jgi:predicted nucleic acid-binding protein